jgi:hypothetical protein
LPRVARQRCDGTRHRQWRGCDLGTLPQAAYLIGAIRLLETVTIGSTSDGDPDCHRCR